VWLLDVSTEVMQHDSHNGTQRRDVSRRRGARKADAPCGRAHRPDHLKVPRAASLMCCRTSGRGSVPIEAQAVPRRCGRTYKCPQPSVRASHRCRLSRITLRHSFIMCARRHTPCTMSRRVHAVSIRTFQQHISLPLLGESGVPASDIYCVDKHRMLMGSKTTPPDVSKAAWHK
jgi:hypothetical protein